MSSLKEKFPVMNSIKTKMKGNDEIKIDQIKGYNRRVQNSPILQLHVQMIQDLTEKLKRSRTRNKELQKELDRIESIFSDRTETIESLEEKLEFLKSRKV